MNEKEVMDTVENLRFNGDDIAADLILKLWKDLNDIKLTPEQKEVVDFILNYSDIFGFGYIGYWAMGLKRYDDEGWLLCDTEDEDIMHDAAIKGWEDLKILQEGVWFLGKEQAKQVVLSMDNIEDWDATDIDNAIQKTLLGEIVYG